MRPCAGRSLDDYNRLLHVVIVGGGPTGVEVAGELSNLINRDLKRIYPDRAKAMRWVPWVSSCTGL
jgi:NADH:ubiquinone reductase (non-electrogenic)